MMVRLFALLILSLLSSAVFAQNTNQRYSDYIERWAPEAMRQQELHNIPASITLAQGLLESGAGTSRLATEGNNHFGIKCHRDWEGETMLRDDDRPDECFRVYVSPEESYTDHSLFLLRKRYQSLFSLPIEDYEGWAHGLKKCGYATDPNYAYRLISIIERYALYNYDKGIDYHPTEDALFIIQHLQNTHPIRITRELHYVIANPGEKYSDIADEFGMNLDDLLEYNDMEHDSEITPWQEVFLQEKHDRLPKNVNHIVVSEGETLHALSQRLATKLKTLKRVYKSQQK